MKSFLYTYKNADNALSKGRVQAQNIAQAKVLLKKASIKPLSLKLERPSLKEILFTEKSVSENEIVVFTQLFAGCIDMGLTIKDSLDLLAKQVENRLLQKKINDILLDIKAGNKLSSAFIKHTDTFPVFLPMLLKAGEASGALGSTLNHVGNYLERISTIKKEIIGVFTYPAIVSLIGLLLLAVILMFVAPTFKEIFQDAGIELPLPTQILFGISDTIILHHKNIILGLLAISALFFWYYRSEKGKYKIHSTILFIPLLGRVIKESLMLRFLRTFEILVNNSVPMLEALHVLEESTSNVRIKKIISGVRQDVSRGLPIAGPLIKERTIIPPIVSYSVSLGEKSGNLGITLKRTSDFIDKEINHSMKRVSSRLDPILTMGLGIMVLFIALSIYLPIFDMMTQTL